MTVKSKKILVGFAASAILALTSVTAAAASLPANSPEWEGSVGYGNVKVGDMVKTVNSNVSTFSFTESPSDIKVWLTTYRTINGTKGIASDGILLSYKETKSAQTSARKDDYVTLEASREHWRNPVLSLGGKWQA